MNYPLKNWLKTRPGLHALVVKICFFFIRIHILIGETKRRHEYYKKIKSIKEKKKIVINIKHGGIGDFLIYSTLPRLLKKKYDVDFYVSKKSLSVLRNSDTLNLCFTLNPYFKGISDDFDIFEFEIFQSEKSIYSFIFSRNGKSAIEIIEKQFDVSDKGIPEIYYNPQKIENYADIILIDKNTISGANFGWKYKKDIFEQEAEKHRDARSVIEYVDPKKQNLLEYVDMIYSCKRFIATFSGGASIAASFNKPFSVIWPYNAINESNFNFRYSKSAGEYIK